MEAAMRALDVFRARPEGYAGGFRRALRCRQLGQRSHYAARLRASRWANVVVQQRGREIYVNRP